MHAVGIHHPRHDLLVRVHIRRRDVFLRPNRVDDLGDIAAGQRPGPTSGEDTPRLPSPLYLVCRLFFFNDTATTEIYTLSLHDALPISAPSASPSRLTWWCGRHACCRYPSPTP